MFTQEDGRVKLACLRDSFSVEQGNAYHHVKWLISDNTIACGTGRSYLLAILYIEEAINNPGKMVHIIDHNILTYSLCSAIPHYNLRGLVRKLCTYNSIPMYMSTKENGIRFSPQENRRILPDRRIS